MQGVHTWRMPECMDRASSSPIQASPATRSHVRAHAAVLERSGAAQAGLLVTVLLAANLIISDGVGRERLCVGCRWGS